MTPSAATTAGPLADRLEAPRRRLREAAPGAPADLAPARAELEAVRDELDAAGRTGPAEALRRIALLTEVWECLAAEGSGAASEVAAFCDRALDDLGRAVPDDEAGDVSARIVEETSSRWGQYLGLLDPDPAAPPDVADAFPVDEPVEEDGPSGIDPADLLRMLLGTATPAEPSPEGPSHPPLSRPTDPDGEVPSSSPPHEGGGPGWGASGRVAGVAAGNPGARGPGLPAATPATPDGHAPHTRSLAPVPGWIEVDARRNAEGGSAPPSPAPGLGIDPELREAFLAEAADLFERIEALVLGLGRGHPEADSLHELGRCFHTLKGASGSVGLVELSSLVHALEGRLEEAPGAAAPGLVDRLHDGLRQIEGMLDALRAVPAPGPGPRPEVSSRREAPDPEPPAPAATADGPLRVPSAKIDVLLDLASELITRRGFWATQAGGMREFAAQARACRTRLLASIERLHDLGLAREAPRGAAAAPVVIGPDADLPGLVRRLSEQAEDLAALTEIARASTNLLADQSDALGRLTSQLWEALQAIRIAPVRGLFQRLARVAHDAARVEGRRVEVRMIGEDDGLDRAVQDKAMEPLLHVVRNAVGHGIEPPEDRARAGKPAAGRVTLEARREGNTMVLAVADDGRGLDYAAIEAKGRRLGLIGPGEAAGPGRLDALIFHPGFSTREEANAIAGRGVGMDVVAQEVARLQGTIDLASQPGQGTRLTIRLPVRLSLERAMVVRVDGQALALPVALVDAVQAFEPGDREGRGASAVVRVRDRTVPLVDVREALGFPAAPPSSCPKLLLARGDGEALGLLVDAIEGTGELVFRPLAPLLGGHPVFSGTSLLASGEVILALNPSGMARRLREAGRPAPRAAREPAPVLVVDDSLSVRRVVTRHLRGLGLDVEEASDGLEVLGRLRARSYSMVLTDLEMPNLDGFDLLAELGRMGLIASLPVVVSSTKSDPETRRRTRDLGARAFVAKPVGPEELAGVIVPLLDASRPPLVAPGDAVYSQSEK